MRLFRSLFFCIHGFLGEPSDWDTVLPDGFRSVRFNLFGSGNSEPKQNPREFKQNSENFCHTVQDQSGFNFQNLALWIQSKAKEFARPRILIGYSLGGRIALHSLIQDPDLWDAAVIISTHPGFVHLEERQSRIEADELWARRFEKSEWNQLMSDWNSQPVLRTMPSSTGRPFLRREENFSRDFLAGALRGCSLGKQGDLRTEIQKMKLPILWIAGKEDSKFLALGEEVASMNSRISLSILPNAGHRAPWDQPQSFQDALMKFLF